MQGPWYPGVTLNIEGARVRQGFITLTIRPNEAERAALEELRPRFPKIRYNNTLEELRQLL